MRAVDTNVLARFILNDDPDQSARARAILAEPVWIPITVWLELGWLLSRRLRMARELVSDAVSAILALDTVETADRAGLLWAIERFRAGADWADVVHLLSSQANASSFATFDTRLKRQAGAAGPIEIETLR